MNHPLHRTLCLLLVLLFATVSLAQPAGMLDSASSNNTAFWRKLPNLPMAKNQSGIDCNNWTFRIKLNNGNTKTLVDGILLPTQGFMLAGNDIQASLGFIVRINSEGTLETAQQWSQFNKSVSFKKIKFFSTGYLYILAEITDQLTNITLPLIIVTDIDGNLQWSRQINVAGIPGSWHAVELDEWRENSFSLLITNDSLINVSKLQMDGSVIWSNTYKTKNKPQGISILNEYWDTYIAYNETDSGYQKGVILDIGYDGNYKYGHKIGGSIDGSDYIMQSMRLVNLRPRITALQKNAGVSSFVRLNCDPLGRPGFKEIFTGSFTATNNLITAQSEWSEVLASSNGVSPDVYLTRTFADNYNTPIQSKLITYPNPVSLQTLTRAFDGGSLVGAVTPGPANDIILTKLDSTGVLPVCGSTDAVASFITSGLASRSEILSLLPNQVQLITSALNHTAYDINAVDECKNLNCPDVPQPDTCLRTFFKEYRNNTHSMWMQQIQKSGDTLLLAGRMRETPYVASDRPTIVMMDTLGRLIDSRIFYSDPVIDFSRTIQLRDGNFLSFGYVYFRYDSIEQFVMKYTPQLNILWQKKLFSPDQYRNIADIVESQEGDFYCYVADKLNSTSEKRHIMKLNSSGDPVWFRSYTAGANIFLGSGERYAVLTELGDFIYFKYIEETADWSPHIVKISKADGSVAWVKEYSIPGVYTSFLPYAMIPNDQHIYMFARTNTGNLFMKIAEDGSLVSCKRSTNGISTGGVVKKLNNRFLYSGGADNYSFTTYGLFELDTGFNVLRRQFLQTPTSGGIGNIVSFSDSVTYSAGSFFSINPYWASFSLQKFNFNSSFGSCAVTDFPLTMEDYPLNVLTRSTVMEVLALPQTAFTNGSFVTTPVGYSAYHCGKLPLCNNIDITGAVIICDSVNEYTYHVQRNPGCIGIVNWNIDTIPGRVKIIAITDSTIRIKAMASGPIMIRAKVFASCEWIYDSLLVDLSISPAGVLDLGPDTMLCPGNTILLNAQTGYTTYQWQDGSANSSFLVTSPGIYYVDVTSCGISFRDSVIVNPHPPIPFDAGPDRIKCNNDTLHLQAPVGFINYTWSPNYNISSTNTKNVIINPSSDTAYFVKGEKTPGCFAFDTVRIRVHHSPPVFLGNDTSFCTGGSVLLDAGSGFSSYQWSNAGTGQQINVNAVGNYSVIASTTEGCRSYDTLTVQAIYPNPVVALADKPAICTGASVVFDAGNFNSYLWNTGSITRSITVSTPGMYYVTVTDGNNCSGSDTTRIMTLLPLPAGFLPGDTVICSYGNLKLNPLNVYNSYLWNNSLATPSITVTQPGTYWLQVTDNDNCTGRDSIIVNHKDCMEGFFIPDAFTPNNDGNNDDYKPFLFGNIKQYRFTIYNRWGEKVFESTQPGKGWNGEFAGSKQDTNVFVWTCSYQFEGELIRLEKGSVVLIR